ncbi:LapA family protein [Alkalicoccus chagannorensis]|uniref:LapA family protein n=1 Tax=Alkalicoccus chagannorensis TaxID=427072 RepID=UPI0004059BF4|nr:lipopolysaccharide assembly LapA domain-containing protein [Alkalicoccus chagannorensis]
MRGQWGLIAGLVVILIIAVFAVINVDPVEVNYLFGQSEWPLVLVIIGSVLMGGLIVGFVGIYKIYRLQQENKQLRAGKSPDGGKTPDGKTDNKKGAKPQELGK